MILFKLINHFHSIKVNNHYSFMHGRCILCYMGGSILSKRANIKHFTSKKHSIGRLHVSNKSVDVLGSFCTSAISEVASFVVIFCQNKQKRVMSTLSSYSLTLPVCLWSSCLCRGKLDWYIHWWWLLAYDGDLHGERRTPDHDPVGQYQVLWSPCWDLEHVRIYTTIVLQHDQYLDHSRATVHRKPTTSASETQGSLDQQTSPSAIDPKIPQLSIFPTRGALSPSEPAWSNARRAESTGGSSIRRLPTTPRRHRSDDLWYLVQGVPCRHEEW